MTSRACRTRSARRSSSAGSAPASHSSTRRARGCASCSAPASRRGPPNPTEAAPMTTCKTIQPRLTAYLDGELTDEHGSVVRGHLRECAECRQRASDEAALRDGLRALPALDPPGSLWSGVQARLAAAEVADARTPRWRRAVVRWTRWASLPRLASGGLVAAAAVVLLYWR